MKYLFILIVFVVVTYCCGNKKHQIVDQLFHYRDSLGIARVQYILIDTIQIDINAPIEQRVELSTKILNAKLDLRGKMYHYEWMIDSLEMELKKY